jgi:protocatechuate 3,4-dioxygenase beta subunit
MAMAHTRSFATFILVVTMFSGRVLDEGNGRALEGVRVRAEGPVTTEATTDHGGRFALPNLKPGPYTVTTESADVPMQEFHVTLPPARTTYLDMRVCSTRYDAHCGPPPRGLPY